MKKLFLTLALMLAFGTGSLSAQASTDQPTKMQEVMKSHDMVMDKMPTVSKLINQLQTRANASYKKTKYEDAIADLKNANQSMMTWMENFGKRFDSKEMLKGKELTPQKQEWLLEEEINIEELDEEINLSIAQGKAVLNN